MELGIDVISDGWLGALRGTPPQVFVHHRCFSMGGNACASYCSSTSSRVHGAQGGWSLVFRFSPHVLLGSFAIPRTRNASSCWNWQYFDTILKTSMGLKIVTWCSAISMLIIFWVRRCLLLRCRGSRYYTEARSRCRFGGCVKVIAASRIRGVPSPVRWNSSRRRGFAAPNK